MIATIILLCLMTISLGISMAKHGERQPNYNVWTTLLTIIIELVLFYYAGLFNNFH